jgi:hypothetical protein
MRLRPSFSVLAALALLTATSMASADIPGPGGAGGSEGTGGSGGSGGDDSSDDGGCAVSAAGLGAGSMSAGALALLGVAVFVGRRRAR